MIVPLLMRSISGMEMIRGMNYYGLETTSRDFVCGWVHRPSYYLEKLDYLGFNSIRLPFSLQYVNEGNFEKMDEFFDALSKYGNMTVVLDMHRVFSSHQGPTPTENGVSLDEFIDGWTRIAKRYQNNTQLIGLDIFNEYQGTDVGYWNDILHQILVRLEDVFPNRFLYFVGGTRWGGDLRNINLEDLPFNKRIRYTIHKYSFSTLGNSMEADWDWSFGEFRDIPHKVSVGEWGFKTQNWDQKNWGTNFVNYLIQHNVRDTYFWTIAHSGDTDGLWFDDCENINIEKYNFIKAIWTGKFEVEKPKLRGNNSTNQNNGFGGILRPFLPWK